MQQYYGSSWPPAAIAAADALRWFERDQGGHDNLICLCNVIDFAACTLFRIGFHAAMAMTVTVLL
jgi:hypothetical protein